MKLIPKMAVVLFAVVGGALLLTSCTPTLYPSGRKHTSDIDKRIYVAGGRCIKRVEDKAMCSAWPSTISHRWEGDNLIVYAKCHLPLESHPYHKTPYYKCTTLDGKITSLEFSAESLKEPLLE